MNREDYVFFGLKVEAAGSAVPKKMNRACINWSMTRTLVHLNIINVLTLAIYMRYYEIL